MGYHHTHYVDFEQPVTGQDFLKAVMGRINREDIGVDIAVGGGVCYMLAQRTKYQEKRRELTPEFAVRDHHFCGRITKEKFEYLEGDFPEYNRAKFSIGLVSKKFKVELTEKGAVPITPQLLEEVRVELSGQ